MAIIFLYLALLAVAFFILIVRPQRRQMAARRALIASLEIGDEVITAGGIFGTILDMSDTDLKVSRTRESSTVARGPWAPGPASPRGPPLPGAPPTVRPQVGRRPDRSPAATGERRG